MRSGPELHSLEGTIMIGDGRIVHYSCNSPSDTVLLENGMYPIGHKMGAMSNNEVIILTENRVVSMLGYIPPDQYALTLACERILRDIS